MSELVYDGLSLESHLFVVLNVLPVAATAARKKDAGRQTPRRSGSDEASDAPDCIPAVLRLNGDVQQVTHHRVGHHHRFAIDPSDPIGPEGHRGNLNQRHANSTYETSLRSSAEARCRAPSLWLIRLLGQGRNLKRSCG